MAQQDWIDESQEVLGVADLATDVGSLLDVPGADAAGDVTSAAGGTLNLIEGIQEGNVPQAGRGLRGLGGAYVTYAQYQAYTQAYQQALANGATAEMADAMAQQSASQAASSGAPGAVSNILPWIGVGLSAWTIYNDIAQNRVPTEQTWQGITGMLASTVNPMFLVPMVMSLGASFLDDSRHTIDEVHWWSPDLQVVGQSGDTVYLVDNSPMYYNQWAQGTGDDLRAQRSASKRIFAYNVQTNELQAMGHGRHAGSTGNEVVVGYEYGLHLGGQNLDGGEDIDYDLLWSTEDQEFVVLKTSSPDMGSTRVGIIGKLSNEQVTQYLSGQMSAEEVLGAIGVGEVEFNRTAQDQWQSYYEQPWYTSYNASDGKIGMINPQMMQAQIYNTVLRPQGLAPEQSLTSITLADGTAAQIDGTGGLYDADGNVIGYVNNQGQAFSFSAAKFSGIGDAGIDPIQSSPIGEVAEWDMVSEKLADDNVGDSAGIGAVEFGDNAMDVKTTSTSQISAQFKVPGAERWHRMGQMLERMITAPTATSGKGRLKMVAAGEEAAKKNRLQALLGQYEIAGKAYMTGLQGEYGLAQTAMEQAGATERANIAAEAQLEAAELRSKNELDRLYKEYGADVFKDVFIGPDGLAWLRMGKSFIKWSDELWDDWFRDNKADLPEVPDFATDFGQYDPDVWVTNNIMGGENNYSMDIFNWSDDLASSYVPGDWDFDLGDQSELELDTPWWLTEED